ncbi:nicotinamide riboside kinase 1 isoform X1 [Cynoglossus semilaevis]|uniref:nicotinamide riboside kinase 1 isoform X1 n=2 Tax=Cynoglossus semilaevis TaxID=244447 RepID=UPI000496DB65|nr:nicotinamide riboside kinase 1-like isoform X1 [Cynoglossus semilaevis]
MKTLILGIGGMTNGGKSTLARRLHQQIPNSCIIAQDTYFKDDSVVPVDCSGFKQYDMLSALHMDKMINDVDLWRKDPEAYMNGQGLNKEMKTLTADKGVFVLIVEGFLIFNYGPLNVLFDKKYFMEIPYDVCKERRSSRVYKPPDPPGYFDGHVWPMYLRNREEMMCMVSDMVFLDGLSPKEELLAAVYEDVCQETEIVEIKIETVGVR